MAKLNEPYFDWRVLQQWGLDPKFKQDDNGEVNPYFEEAALKKALANGLNENYVKTYLAEIKKSQKVDPVTQRVAWGNQSDKLMSDFTSTDWYKKQKQVYDDGKSLKSLLNQSPGMQSTIFSQPTLLNRRG